MTPQAQRIAIAEACGWKDVKNVATKRETPIIKGITPDGKWSAVIPDYINDLNVMHEAESLFFLQLVEKKHWLTLSEVMGNGLQVGHWHATAAQRAEAFLKTLGLWQD